MRSLISSIGLVLALAATGAVFTLVMPETAYAQSGRCSSCGSDDVCSRSDIGGGSCNFQGVGCGMTDICWCSESLGCTIIEDPIGLKHNLTPEQVAPEHRNTIFASAQSRDFMRVSDGRLVAWDCTGKLAYVLEKREDGLLVPVPVRDWHGRLATKEIAENGRVTIRLSESLRSIQ